MVEELNPLPFGLSQSQLICNIEPMVPSAILHFYIRNNEMTDLVGVLLGIFEANTIQITNCLIEPSRPDDKVNQFNFIIILDRLYSFKKICFKNK
jgi:hypothetical protein